MILINGETQDHLAVNDRAVQFGDGCFTTARIRNGGIDGAVRHLQRLHDDTLRLSINGVDWNALSSEMSAVATARQDGVLKVILTRGGGGRGYSSVGCQQPTRIVSSSPYPAQYGPLRETGVCLVISPVRLAVNPLLAGIKHLNRLEQVLIRMQIEQTTADEALVLDMGGKLVECCAANLFWRKGSQLFTPRLDGAGVNGIMRQHIMALVSRLGIRCDEVCAEPAELSNADEVLICNALMPVLPVCQIEHWHYTSRQLFNVISPHCQNMESA